MEVRNEYILDLNFDVQCGQEKHSISLRITPEGITEVITPCDLLPDTVYRSAGRACRERLTKLQGYLKGVVRYGSINRHALVQAICEGLIDEDEHVRKAVLEASVRIGAPAVEALTAALNMDRSFGIDEGIIEALVKIGTPAVEFLTAALTHSHIDYREWASIVPVADTLARMGDPRAVEPLLQLLRDWFREERWAKEEQLEVDEWAAEIEAQGFSVPLDELDVYYPPEFARHSLAEALVRLGAPGVIESFGQSDSHLRTAVENAAVRMGTSAVGSLVQALRCPDSWVRYLVMKVLIRIGPPAVQPLIMVLSDEDEDLRERAAYALGQIGDSIRGAVGPLIQALKDTSVSVQRKAAWALGQIKDPRSVEALTQALTHEDDQVCREAAAALSQMGALRTLTDPAFISALIRALGHHETAVRDQAKAALVQMGGLIVESLTRALDNPDRTLRMEVASLLAELNVLQTLNDKELIPVLIEILENQKVIVREQARTALVQIGTPAVESLVRTLENSGGATEVKDRRSHDVQRELLKTLVQIGVPAVELLFRRLKEWDLDLRREVMKTLVEIGDPAIEPLSKLLKVEDKDVRWGTAWILGQIGDPHAVEPLIQALTDEDADVRRAVVEALARIGDSRAIEALFHALNDPDSTVRIVVQRSLDSCFKDCE